jgi:hypothetical protein
MVDAWHGRDDGLRPQEKANARFTDRTLVLSRYYLMARNTFSSLLSDNNLNMPQLYIKYPLKDPEKMLFCDVVVLLLYEVLVR